MEKNREAICRHFLLILIKELDKNLKKKVACYKQAMPIQ